MLPRVLEPEVMDTFEEANDYDAMDHSEVNRVFVEDLLAAGAVAGEVLDLGTGTAQIPVALCRFHEDCRIVAVDASTHMLDLAVYNLELSQLTSRILLIHGDCKQLTFEAGRFPVVISNSIVHHIPAPLEVLREAARVTAPDGWLFFRDLLRPDSDADVRLLVDRYAAGEPDRPRQLFDQSLRAALTLGEMRELVGQLGAPPDSVQATSDRHWTWHAQRSELRLH